MRRKAWDPLSRSKRGGKSMHNWFTKYQCSWELRRHKESKSIWSDKGECGRVPWGNKHFIWTRLEKCLGLVWDCDLCALCEFVAYEWFMPLIISFLVILVECYISSLSCVFTPFSPFHIHSKKMTFPLQSRCIWIITPLPRGTYILLMVSSILFTDSRSLLYNQVVEILGGWWLICGIYCIR